MTLRSLAVPCALAGALAFYGFAGVPAALAGSPHSNDQLVQAAADTPKSPAAADGVSNDEVMTYARATAKVQTIRRDFEVQKRSVTHPQQIAQLAETANNQMVEAVETEGLSVDRFNEISEAADSDPQLRTRILDQIAKHTQPQ